MSEKYPHPCSDCGLCCMAQICRHGMKFLEMEGRKPETNNMPCPLLRWEGKKSRCGIILYMQDMHQLLPEAVTALDVEETVQAMGSGQGCCFKGWVGVATTSVNSADTLIDFASLPAEAKEKYAQQLKEQINVRT